MSLSNIPSVLILQALADLRIVEKTPRYRVDMHTFLAKTEDEKNQMVCTVCLAGATAAARLPKARELIEKPKTEFYSSEFFDSVSFDEKMKLYALDSFRKGDVDDGLRELSQCSDSIVNEDEYFADVQVVPYDENKKLFYKQMKKLAKKLQERGL